MKKNTSIRKLLTLSMCVGLVSITTPIFLCINQNSDKIKNFDVVSSRHHKEFATENGVFTSTTNLNNFLDPTVINPNPTAMVTYDVLNKQSFEIKSISDVDISINNAIFLAHPTLVIDAEGDTAPIAFEQIGETAFAQTDSHWSWTGTITIPGTVNAIFNEAFCSCNGISNVIFENSQSNATDLEIYNEAFAYCDGLTSVSLPTRLSLLKDYAFLQTPLKNISITGETSEDPTTTNYTLLTLGQGKVMVSTDTLDQDGNWTYLTQTAGCLACGDVDLSNNSTCTSLKSSAFFGCCGLTSFKNGENISEIATWAFRECENLTSIDLGEKAASIGYGAFMDCTNLKSIMIPHTVTNIASSVFWGCSNLTNIICPWSSQQLFTTVNIDESWLDPKLPIKSISVPYGLSSVYSQSQILQGILHINYPIDIYEYDDAQVLIKNATGHAVYSYDPSNNTYTLIDGTNLSGENLIFSDQISSIDESAFLGNTNISGSVILNDGLTSIGYQAFKNCTNITSINIPSSIASIGADAFFHCKINEFSFSWESIPKNIDHKAFEKNNQGQVVQAIVPELTSKNYFDNLQTYGFSNTVALYERVKADSTVFISGSCLTGDLLVEYDVNTQLYNIVKVENGFGCYSLTFSDYIQTIDSNAFINFNVLSGDLTMPSSITKIDTNAFNSENVAFNAIKFPWNDLSNITVADSVFNQFKSLNTIYLPHNGHNVYTDDILTKWGFSLTNDNVNVYEKDDASYWTNGGQGQITTQYNSTTDSYTIIEASELSGENVVLDDSISIIASNAFADCTNVDNSLILPSSISSIQSNAFANSQFNKLIFEDSPSLTVGENILSNALVKYLIFGWSTDELNSASLSFDNNWLNNATVSGGIVCDIDDLTAYQNHSSDIFHFTDPTVFNLVFDNVNKYISNAIGSVIYDLTSTKLVDATLISGENIAIKNNVTEIDNDCFKKNKSILGNITIPDTLTSINQRIFTGCENIVCIYLNWNSTQLTNMLANDSISEIWLGNLNRSSMHVCVPSKYQKFYKQHRVELGLDNVDLVDQFPIKKSPFTLILTILSSLMLASFLAMGIYSIIAHQHKTPKNNESKKK